MSRSETWRQILGFSSKQAVRPIDINKAYHRLSKQHHPTLGGCPTRWQEISDAVEQAHSEVLRD